MQRGVVSRAPIPFWLAPRLRAWVFLCFLTVALTLCAVTSNAQDFAPYGKWVRSPQLGAEDFLSHVITDIEGDDEGRVWIATDMGIAWTADDGQTWSVVNLAYAEDRYRRRRADDEGSTPERLSGQALIERNKVTSIAQGWNVLWVGTMNGLCCYSEDQRNWYYFPDAPEVPGPSIWAVEARGSEVWASSSRGLYRSHNNGIAWERLSDGLPNPIRSITLLGTGRNRICWLAGFDADPAYGGGPDLLYTEDDGKTWVSRSTKTASVIAGVVSARAHRVVKIGDTLWACTRHGLASSSDRGAKWHPMLRRTGLSGLQVFDIVEKDGNLWAATEEGLFVAKDNGQSWERGDRLRSPVTRLLVAGKFIWMGTRGGALRSTMRGDWRAFSVHSHVLALAKSVEYGAETWWVGTTGGLAFSRDRGATWRTLTVEDGLPSNLVLDLHHDGERLWAATDGGVWSGREGGQSGKVYASEEGLRGLWVRDIHVVDGTVYAATNKGLCVLTTPGTLWRTYLSGKKWRCVGVIDDTVFGVLDRNAGEGTSHVLIRGSLDKEKWQECLLPGYTAGEIRQILTLGNVAWAATDCGLYRSRDLGETWARFGAASLQSSRVTRMATAAGNFLCVQTVPNDPPSVAGTTFLNFTNDDGRTWRMLSTAVPGHANAVALLDDALIIGTQYGVSTYADFERDLRPSPQRWLVWRQIAALAASTRRKDQLGWVSAVDRFAFHGPTLWLGSRGRGLLERGVPVLDDLDPPWDVATGKEIEEIRWGVFQDGKDILAIADSEEGIWCGTAKGLLYFDRLASWNWWPPDPDVPFSAPVRAVTVRGSQMWVGSDKGLSMLDRAANAWQHITAGEERTVYDLKWHDSPQLPDNRLTALACDGENIWGGTERGAFVIDAENRWRLLLPEEKISHIALGSARVYFGTNRGVFTLDRQEDVGKRKRHLRQGHTPLRDNRVYRVFVDNRDIWAATPEGIRKILYEPAEPEFSDEVEPSLRGPEGVLVVINDASEASRTIGKAYSRLRGIPDENVCLIVCPEDETVSRQVYQRQIRDRIWRHLREHKLSRKISFIVTTSGVPLRIASEVEDKDRPPNLRDEACVDSELTLLARNHPRNGRLLNSYLHRQEAFDSTRFGMYLVTRLDGPTILAAQKLARNAVAIEEERSYGSRGSAYFDMHPLETPDAIRLNAGIRKNYDLLRREQRLIGRVVLPEQTTMPYFRTNACANSFFYLGWGDAEYRKDVISWTQGAVGANLERLTAPSLRNTEGSWVAAAVEAGITGTVGNVYDAGADDHLSPANLYRYVHEGFTWAEAAYMCIPYLSWQTVVIGDPLYAPLK